MPPRKAFCQSLAKIPSIGLQTICFPSVQTVRVCSELLLRVVLGGCWGMILVNLHCSSGQVYKQAFLCRISFMCKKVGWLQTTLHGIMLQQTPGRTNFSSHTYTSLSCVKARKFFSELDTAPNRPVSGRGGNFCARVSVARSPWSW